MNVSCEELPSLEYRKILGMRVDATSYQDAVQRILHWAQQSVSCYVCCANVHMTMEAYDSPDFQAIVNDAALVVPDGMPLVWTMHRLGIPEQPRVYGPDLAFHVYQAAAREEIPIGFYGGRPEVLQQMLFRLQTHYPNLQIAYSYSPPFRDLSAAEEQVVVDEINASGARILMVGLGCPKQERWMHRHGGKIQAVMLGVGAAFDFHAGTVRQAPSWMQDAGLEWLFRLIMEPRRLTNRYIKHNPRFLWLVTQQIAGLRSFLNDLRKL